MANPWERLRLSVAEMASGWVWFPRQPGLLYAPDIEELGRALEQIGRDVRAGKLNHSNSIAIPIPRRTHMKIELDIRGPKKPGGKKANGEYMDFTLNYYELGDQYTDEVANAAKSYASLIQNTPGTATADPKYTVTFKATPERGQPITGEMRGLKYSEMKTLEDAGLGLLAKLNEGAEVEIRAGQRV